MEDDGGVETMFMSNWRVKKSERGKIRSFPAKSLESKSRGEGDERENHQIKTTALKDRLHGRDLWEMHTTNAHRHAHLHAHQGCACSRHF